MIQAALARRERVVGVTVAISSIAVAAMALGLTFPLIGLILEGEGWSRTAIGVNSAMAPLAILITAQFIPLWVNRLGAKKVILAAVLTDVVLLVALKAFQNYYIWLPIRFVMGVAVAALFVTSESWINQVTENHNRGRVMALYNTVLSAAFASGPLLIWVVGVDGWTPFVAGAAIMAAAALPMAFVPVVAPVFEGRPSFSVWRYLWIAPTLAGAMLLYAMIENGSTALMAVFGRRSGLPDAEAVTLISAVVFGGMVFAFPVGWLADRMDRIKLLVILAAAATFLIVLLPGLMDSRPARLLDLFLWGGAAASIYTVAMAIQGERFSGADLVTANAAFGTLYGFGALAGPMVLGASMDYHDPEGFVWAMVAICGTFTVFTIVRQRLKRG
ncbi:MFS transporter [Minwuia thermotolerans]|uniref:Major facilitator superfamily (MFS) profile domain-containing protein n=1 Tax=Minwuia thermotolerans TaxID=2056226 RepID=A0A2M9FVV6_9PROT|nr:MFS transporter [Minwuia thermotolerans]PJK27605.1 hypothetical protein CVT23_22095 [Minwuia thermotolerans]